MSVRVLRHGDKRRIKNPITGQWQNTTNIVFIEEGRKGAIDAMATTTAALSAAIGGEQVGIQIARTHTHPIVDEAVGNFPEGKVFPNLYINRKMFSTPQVSQQEGVKPRMVEGKPTYFTTEIAEVAKEDVDLRYSTEVLATLKPEFFTDARVGVAEVMTRENSPVPSQGYGADNQQGGPAGNQGQQNELAEAGAGQQGAGNFAQNPGM
jgi:hypothetical protein